MAEDLDSDFRVFYRKTWDEMVATETGPRFFALCYRVSAYAGVMAARHAATEAETQSPPVGSVPDSEVKEIGSSQAELRVSPLGDLIEFGEG